MTKDIFDMNNLEDLPENLRHELLLDGKAAGIMSLIEKAGRPLNINELLVAYYREFGAVKTRNWMVQKCYKLTKKKVLKPTGRKGEYDKLPVT